jgi:hypothetical protein
MNVTGLEFTCTILDDFGERVGTQYAVTEIDFGSPNKYAGNGFSGTLSADVGLLTSLNRFDFASNRIIGTLPESLGQWIELNAFSVNGNALVGSLPESIGQWKALVYFGVKENTLTGTIPSSIGNWSQSVTAVFDNNQFTGAIPDEICRTIQNHPGSCLATDSEIPCNCCTIGTQCV